MRLTLFASLSAIFLSACQTTNTGSAWVPVIDSDKKIELVGVFKNGSISRHIAKNNADAIQEFVEWKSDNKRAAVLYYELHSNTFFDERLALQKVLEIRDFSLPRDAKLQKQRSFHNAVDLVNFALFQTASKHCMVFSLAFGEKSYVTSTHPVGNRWGVGFYCQGAEFRGNLEEQVLSSIGFKNWNKFPEKAAPYLSNL